MTEEPRHVVMDKQAPSKPSLRGVLHHWAAFFAFGGGTVLVAMAPTWRATAASAVYALSLVLLFGVSATYHRVQWSERARAWMRRADHASIFVLIAGTYTPIALLGLRGSEGKRLFIYIWAGATLGVVLSLFWVRAPKALTSAIAVAVGWTIAPYVGEVRRLLGPYMWVILAGGIAYTVGAIVYAMKRPNPRPATFGYHEVFHALTILGAALHFVAVIYVVRSSGG
jgi:hemolysin III